MDKLTGERRSRQGRRTNGPIAADSHGQKNVLSPSTFSKTLATGLRIRGLWAWTPPS